jgi:ATP synthase protein I
MTNRLQETEKKTKGIHQDFEEEIRSKERRKLRALRQGDLSVFFGLGMFGVVGWLVAIPALLFTALGAWLDSKFKRPYSWTLTLLFAGVILGCLGAWFWISKERKEIERQRKEDTDEL